MYRFNALMKSKNKKIARKYIIKAYKYMDTNFPGWKKRYNPKMLKSGLTFSKKSKFFALFYLYLPLLFKTKAHLFRKKLVKERKIFLSNKEKKLKRRAIKNNGYRLIASLNDVFEAINVTYFADFGTLLGFVREGRLMSHDLDVDIGVITGDVSKEEVKIAMEKAGFRLYRQYIYNGDTVEDSYHFFDGKKGVKIKFDINYYENGDDYSKTWLFYWNRNWKYKKKNERHIVEMTYSRIPGVKTIKIHGMDINIPINAEQLLEEKYGPSWRVKDKTWIYWESPAAKKLDDIGYFS